MKKRTKLWLVGIAAVVAALVFAGSSLADPGVTQPVNATWADISATTPSAWTRPVSSTLTRVAFAPATRELAQPTTATTSASQSPVTQLPNAVAPSSPPSVTAAPVGTDAPGRPVVPTHRRATRPLWFGLYVPGAPESMKPVTATESRVGRHAAVVNFFVADSEAFPRSRAANIVAHGSTPLVTLEFWSIGSAGLGAITDGSKDAYIRRFARDAKAFHKVIWLRPFHEMNTRHYPWGAQGSNTPAKLVAAYRHVHDIFVAEGATNVKFVWCPNIDYKVAPYYPGDRYVDYVAIDGYNTGKPWRTFSSLFGKTYTSVAAVTPKPIFIAETACTAGPGKAAWVTDMFEQIASAYPRIAGVCWFDMNKEHDWRVNSSKSSVVAVKAALARF